ncbi:hypothetical protein V6N11_061897 [Hibiscus sabdariffa]|uniref:Uncharacterized protein n=1 Tax=Hibiscus sabdariffa TaxID=183260 RepID=A0ABR2N7G3_9ROSI
MKSLEEAETHMGVSRGVIRELVLAYSKASLEEVCNDKSGNLDYKRVVHTGVSVTSGASVARCLSGRIYLVLV